MLRLERPDGWLAPDKDVAHRLPHATSPLPYCPLLGRSYLLVIFLSLYQAGAP
jgi:hypothetical protein